MTASPLPFANEKSQVQIDPPAQEDRRIESGLRIDDQQRPAGRAFATEGQTERPDAGPLRGGHELDQGAGTDQGLSQEGGEERDREELAAVGGRASFDRADLTNQIFKKGNNHISPSERRP